MTISIKPFNESEIPIIVKNFAEYDGYGDAQKLYVKKGYVPDGKCVTYN